MTKTNPAQHKPSTTQQARMMAVTTKASRLVRDKGGDLVAQDFAAQYAKLTLSQGWSVAESINAGIRAGMRIHRLNGQQTSITANLPPKSLSYIKANTVVNKAVSNLFGLSTSLKKVDMSADMLSVREKVFNDYVKLYQALGDNTAVKEALYAKYQPENFINLSGV